MSASAAVMHNQSDMVWSRILRSFVYFQASFTSAADSVGWHSFPKMLTKPGTSYFGVPFARSNQA